MVEVDDHPFVADAEDAATEADSGRNPKWVLRHHGSGFAQPSQIELSKI